MYSNTGVSRGRCFDLHFPQVSNDSDPPVVWTKILVLMKYMYRVIKIEGLYDVYANSIYTFNGITTINWHNVHINVLIVYSSMYNFPVAP